MKNKKTKKLVLSALFIAVIAACSWISFPTPFGVNLTISLLGVCLSAFVLGAKYSIASTIVYIALGAVGLPVFSMFSGGIGVLVGVSGGFLWGFIVVSALCGVAKATRNKVARCVLMLLAVILCHTAGVIQYSVVTGNNFLVSFLTVSLPFLLKDFLLVFLARLIAKKIKIK